MKNVVFLTLIMCGFAASFAQPTTYKALYKKAYYIAVTHPDSAIHYAKLAIKATTKAKEKAKAHKLLGYYAARQGYYSMAIDHYQQAYDLYSKQTEQAKILVNLASCYKNIGNTHSAINIAKSAAAKFSVAKDSTNVVNALYFLGDCYFDQLSLRAADSTYKLGIQIAKNINHPMLSDFYHSYAHYQTKNR